MKTKKIAKKKSIKKAKPKAKPKRSSEPLAAEWHLLLYVAGMTPKSSSALANLKALCEEHLKGKYAIEVIDLLEKPQLAKGDQILAIPTLVRRLPSPIKKMIGDLSNSERVLVGLNLKAIGF